MSKPKSIKKLKVRGQLSSRYNILFLPIAIADYGMPLLVAVLSVCAYFVFVVENSYPVSVIEIIFIALNVLAFLYSVYWRLPVELRPLYQRGKTLTS